MNNFKKYHCESCDTHYSDKRALTRHYKTKKHNGNSNKLYQCETCNYETYDAANWKRHTLTKKHLLGGPLSEGQKCTKCQLCHKEFKNNHSYRSHMSTHNMSKVKFVEHWGVLSAKRKKLRKKLLAAQQRIDKGKGYKSKLIHKPVRGEKMSYDDAAEIVADFPGYIDTITDEIKRYHEFYYTKLKDVPIHAKPDIRELEAKLRDAQKVVDELDRKMEKKGKQLKEMSKKDQTRYNRHELIIKVIQKKLKKLRG